MNKKLLTVTIAAILLLWILDNLLNKNIVVYLSIFINSTSLFIIYYRLIKIDYKLLIFITMLLDSTLAYLQLHRYDGTYHTSILLVFVMLQYVMMAINMLNRRLM